MSGVDYQFAYLSKLNQLGSLNDAIRTRIPKGNSEIQADFENMKKFLATWPGIKQDSEGAEVEAGITHRRRYQMREKEILRQSRANIFAIAFSTFEMFLATCILSKMPSSSKFFAVKAKLDGLAPNYSYFLTSEFKLDWQKADNYRQVRNVITHQASLFDTDDKVNLLMGTPRTDFFCEAVDFPVGFKEVVIGDIYLPEILEFFQRFALRIDTESIGVKPC
jgi:hypothetical protein